MVILKNVIQIYSYNRLIIYAYFILELLCFILITKIDSKTTNKLKNLKNKTINPFFNIQPNNRSTNIKTKIISLKCVFVNDALQKGN